MALVDTSVGGEGRLAIDPLDSVTGSVIRPIVRRKLHVSLSEEDASLLNQDAMELVAEVRLVLFAEIQKRSGHTGHDIRDLGGFAATVTSNACYQYFRSSFPVRTQQKNKIRYLLSHHTSFAVWRGNDERWLCGYFDWKGSGKRYHAIGIPAESPGIEKGSSERRIYESIIEHVFDTVEAPVLLDELVQYVMQVRGLRERVRLSDDAESEGVELENVLSDPRPRADAVVESFDQLGRIWKEILKLPLQHRKALLLNLKDSSGDGLIAALPLSGVASIREIAAALEIAAQELAAIWNSLPWEDLRIAEHLGMTRQQVINLRQSARVRLTRVCR